MRVIVQRVLSARVEVDGRVTGSIGPGLLVLAGLENGDTPADLAWMSSKLTRMRIFPDADGVMNRSVVDTNGDVLAVSQFTLFASVRKGNRPSWSRAAPPILPVRCLRHSYVSWRTILGGMFQPGSLVPT